MWKKLMAFNVSVSLFPPLHFLLKRYGDLSIPWRIKWRELGRIKITIPRLPLNILAFVTNIYSWILAKFPDFPHVMQSCKAILYTTHSWDYLGLDYYHQTEYSPTTNWENT